MLLSLVLNNLKRAFRTALTLLLLLTLATNAAFAVDKTDLESIMKQMRFEYTRALKTDSEQVLTTHIEAFKAQLKLAKNYPHNKERREKALEGLNKVSAVIDSITLPVAANELTAVRQTLAKIDDIKEQYHDKKVSLWERFYERLFGENEDNEKLILIEE